MKTKIILRIAVLFFIVINISCSKDSDSDSTINLFQAKVSGSLINFGGGGVGVHENTFSVSKCKNDQQIKLTFPISVGTYSVSEGEITLFYSVGRCLFGDIPDYYYAIEGSLTLTESNDTKIKGTFHFIGENGRGFKTAITEGVFDIEY